MHTSSFLLHMFISECYSKTSSSVLATILKCNEYVSKVFSCIMKVGSNIGPAAAGSARPAPTPLLLTGKLNREQQQVNDARVEERITNTIIQSQKQHS